MGRCADAAQPDSGAVAFGAFGSRYGNHGGSCWTRTTCLRSRSA